MQPKMPIFLGEKKQQQQQNLIYRELLKSNLAFTESLTLEIINPISKKILVKKLLFCYGLLKICQAGGYVLS